MNNSLNKDKCGNKNTFVSNAKWLRMLHKWKKQFTKSVRTWCKLSFKISKKSMPNLLIKNMQKYSNSPVSSFPFKPILKSWIVRNKSIVNSRINSKIKSRKKIVLSIWWKPSRLKPSMAGRPKWKKIWQILGENYWPKINKWSSHSKQKMST